MSIYLFKLEFSHDSKNNNDAIMPKFKKKSCENVNGKTMLFQTKFYSNFYRFKLATVDSGYKYQPNTIMKGEIIIDLCEKFSMSRFWI